ncbi:hypothetical protein ACFQV4_11385 [Streptomyces thermocarboxydus]
MLLESLGIADVRHFHVRLEEKTTATTGERNAAELVEPPRTENRESEPWSLNETLDFLCRLPQGTLHAAFVVAIALGLRRGDSTGD